MGKNLRSNLTKTISAVLSAVTICANCGGMVSMAKSTAVAGSGKDTVVDADIFVNKIEGCDEDFITGADLSSFATLYNAGVRYYDYDGKELDEQGYFDFLHDCGVNYARIRIWNDPYDEKGNGYGGGNCDLENAKKIGKWATDAGMKVLIDFHYSDFWADPGKQTEPKAWKDMKVDEKATALKKYTTESLKELMESGVDVGMVQVGNETNNGICGEDLWANMIKMMKAGSEGVRAASKDILVAVHFANPEKGYKGVAQKLSAGKVDYDVFASSYYPYWHGSLDNLKKELEDIAKTYDKKVMVAETSYVYTFEDGDGCGNTESEGKLETDTFDYDISEQGQADSVAKVVETVASMDSGIGVFYWEPAWLPVNVYKEGAKDALKVMQENQKSWKEEGTGWASVYAKDYDKDVKEYGGGGAVVENEAWFDFEGHPLASAKMYSYMRTGARTELKISKVIADDVTVSPDEKPVLPKTVKVKYNDGSEKSFNAQWDEKELEAAIKKGAGTYTISGTVGDGKEKTDVTCSLEIKADNLLVNPGFEDGDEGWTLTTKSDKKDISIVKHSDCHSGEWCMKFWSSAAFEFKLEQKVKLDKGTYSLSAFLHGGDSKSGDQFKIFAVVDGKELSESTGVTKWHEYKNPTLTGIEIKEDGTEITIGAYTKASANCWGAYDDFVLWKE